MSTIAHYARVSYLVPLLVTAIVLALFIPSGIRAQERQTAEEVEEAEFETPNAITVGELDAIEAESEQINGSGVVPVDQIPYITEPLLGDKVFGDFVVGPGKLEVSIEPGQTKVVEITVSNRTGATRAFSIEAEDAQGSQDISKTVVLLGDQRGPYSMKDYISVEAPKFELQHNQRARVPVTISLPPDAEPGGLYGSVLVSTVTTEAKAGDNQTTASQSAVIARVGSLFFITVPGEIEAAGEVIDFSVIPKKLWYEGGPINFGILFENTGSIHLTPFGELAITNMFGEEVGFTEVESWFVMPNAKRLREISWNREFLLGRYTATLRINRGYETIIDTKTMHFWVIPWKIAAATFFGLFLFFYLIRVFFRTFEFKRK